MDFGCVGEEEVVHVRADERPSPRTPQEVCGLEGDMADGAESLRTQVCLQNRGVLAEEEELEVGSVVLDGLVVDDLDSGFVLAE